MMISRYRLQVVDTMTHQVIRGWQPGDRCELDMAADLAKRLESQPIGLFSSKQKVLTEVNRAFLAMIHGLKERV